MATVAFYGPTGSLATKVAVGLVREEDAEPEMHRWTSEDRDIRIDAQIDEEIVTLLETEGIRSVVISDGLLGCPHEEGIDYPEGESCPECPYWKGRDRFTGERTH